LLFVTILSTSPFIVICHNFIPHPSIFVQCPSTSVTIHHSFVNITIRCYPSQFCSTFVNFRSTSINVHPTPSIHRHPSVIVHPR
jgi:hypothetical protein